MRLWHEKLISYLDNQRILGQYRECCALRGLGWNKKHKTVDYVFTYNPYKLVRYHRLVMREMVRRGFKPDLTWDDCRYRGKNCLPWDNQDLINDVCNLYMHTIYPEHNDAYLNECLENLKDKGIKIIL